MSKIHSSVGHILLLIHDYEKNILLYREMFKYFGYEFSMDSEYGIGVQTGGPSVWVMKATDETKNNRDSNGLNHFGFHVESKEEVDTFIAEFLKPNNIKCLFDTPKDRPEFFDAEKGGEYYQVMFEFPGSVLFEVVYTK